MTASFALSSRYTHLFHQKAFHVNARIPVIVYSEPFKSDRCTVLCVFTQLGQTQRCGFGWRLCAEFLTVC